MIRRTALLSAMSLSLLLGACSKNDEPAAADEGKQAQVADAQAAEAPAAEPAPERKLDYWKALGPLLALASCSLTT